MQLQLGNVRHLILFNDDSYGHYRSLIELCDVDAWCLCVAMLTLVFVACDWVARAVFACSCKLIG